MQPIVIADVTVPFEEYQSIHQQLAGWRTWAIRLALVVGVVFVFWTNSAVLVPALGWRVAIIALVAAGMLVMSRFSLRRTLKKIHAGAPALTLPTTYTLDADTIRVTNSASTSTLRWDAIRQVRAVPGWWLLRTTNNGGFLLDTRRVVSPATAADVTALFQHHHLLR